MDSFAVFLTGFGILGILGVVLLGGIVFAIIPIWAIVDCSNSKREGNVKTMIIVALCLTWGLGSLIYGIFVTKTKFLRRFSLVSFVALISLLILSLGSCFYGARIMSEKRAIQQEAKREQWLQELRARGFLNTMKGQTFSIEKDITEPIFFEAQTFKLWANSTSDLCVEAQVCEIYGTVEGDLIFHGQVLTIQPKAVIKGNLEVDAQVLKKYGEIMGNVTGNVQVQKE